MPKKPTSNANSSMVTRDVERLAALQTAREEALDAVHLAANRGFIPDALLWSLHQNRNEEADLHLAECVAVREQTVADERAQSERLFALLDQPEPVTKWRVIDGLGTIGGTRRSAANG